MPRRSDASRTVLIALAAAVTTATVAGTPAPVLLWQESYDGGPAHHDYAKQLVTTDRAIYVAASTQDSENPADFTLLRYSLDGHLLWERHYGGTWEHTGEPSDLAVAPGGGVIITGLTAHGADRKITTIRYGARGRVHWMREQALVGPFTSLDGPRLAVAADSSIRVSASAGGDFFVVAYEASGARMWTRRIDGSDGGDDIATDVAVDPDGNTYVAGPVGGGFGGFSTAKLDADGGVEWVHNVHGPFGATLGAAFVEVGPDGSAVVSAVPESTCGLFQSRTWKLAPDGSEEWQTAYPPDPCDSIDVVGMRVRADGSVVVLGTELRFGESDHQFTTLSLDASGNLEWVRTLGGEATDLATALAVDPTGNAYVTGVGAIGRPENDALTASYDRAGELRWQVQEDAGNPSETPAAIAVVPDDTVAVTGDYFQRLEDVLTLRYRQPPSPSTG